MIPIQHTVDTPYMVGPVHCYSSELDGELVLFDTGPPTETGRAYLEHTIDLGRLRHVLVSHCHIDHYGQSAWLAEASEATVYLPYRDVQKIRYHDERMRCMYELLAGMGFSRDYLEKLRQAFLRGGLLPPVPEHYLIAERDLPPRLGIEVLPCPGHSQSDLVYHGAGWAVTGDILLRGIFQSPLLDIDLESGGRFNNYRAYCDSIVKLAALRGKIILPG
ncbi:MAG: MBL fold metallo-hydrolase, partial [Desulfofustis sp.]|nr:MBL fold metallo-hydrolase [Desulfofustis sp.]